MSVSVPVSPTAPIVDESGCLPLSELPSGCAASIVRVDGDDQQVTQFYDLGFRDGERVEITARGLIGGSPLAVQVGRATLALRRQEAEVVWVARLA